MTKVNFISITPFAESHLAFVARVSNPQNQNNPNYKKLIKYCIKHKHWSVFESAYMTIEIETSRGIAAQILRHRSFTFQEFSQRYSTVDIKDLSAIVPDLRKQCEENKQSSIELEANKKKIYEDKVFRFYQRSLELYKEMIEDGVAKESARFVLPLGFPTKLYMTGNVRSWIHYIELREYKGTQKEHREVAKACKDIFIKRLPTVSEALEWDNSIRSIPGAEEGLNAPIDQLKDFPNF